MDGFQRRYAAVFASPSIPGDSMNGCEKASAVCKWRNGLKGLALADCQG